MSQSGIVTSTVLSSVSFGTSLTGARVAASIPLGKHAEVCGVVSIVSAEVRQKLGAKVLKHEKNIHSTLRRQNVKM